MTEVANPALAAFVRQLGPELILAQVLISRDPRGFELRHLADRGRRNEELRLLSIPEIRNLAQFTAAGAFRPLKSAPNLQTGWRILAANASELDLALLQLYPNAVADWFAAQQPVPPLTHYRDFTNRQTGMYRVTQHLTDAQAAAVIRACCDRRVCLKRRLWSVAGLEADPPALKSLIPCLEPCAILLEFARTVTRLEQSPAPDLNAEQPAALAAALEASLQQSIPACREADFSAPSNPRRMLWTLEKLRLNTAPGTPEQLSNLCLS